MSGQERRGRAVSGADHTAAPRTDRLRPAPRWYLRTNRWWARFLMRRRFAVVLHDVAHVPATGPVIYAANHIGVVDGPLLAIFSPRPAHALTKREMFRGPLGAFLWLSGQIPLDRERVDVRAVRLAVRALRDGQVVGIFPEGTRGDGLVSHAHYGAAYLALVTGAPVVPVAILGSREPGASGGSLPASGGTVHMVYGETLQFAPQPWPRTRVDVAAAGERLRAHLAAHVVHAQRLTGVALPGPLPAPAGPAAPPS